MVHSFAGNRLDRAAQKRLDDGWLAAKWNDTASRYVCFAGERPLVRIGADPTIVWDTRFDTDLKLEDAIFLGLDDDGQAIFGVALAIDDDGAPKSPISDDTKLIDLRSLAAQGILPTQELGMLSQARSMLLWHQTHRYCSTCGKLSVSAEGGYKRRCPDCGREHFPRTDPVVIMVVCHGDEILLGRGAHFVPGSYSALAGFVEPGESIEEAARREIFEESGIVVGDIRYHSSQPWPFPSSLMIGLIGMAESRELKIDYDELEDARWFHRDEVALMLAREHPDELIAPPALAIAHHLIKAFVQSEV